ncbi:S-layer homology domain-containing protein [Lysinibacillus sp. MHQ-1]|nr:S-layer homology domain-containing protein [Lysinibacillus sp. MHQ-1]
MRIFLALIGQKNYIESLADIGIISGVEAKRFAPDQLVTRAQFAVFVERSIYFQQKNKQIGSGL